MKKVFDLPILFWVMVKISRIIYGFYMGHNQNLADTRWIGGPLGQAIDLLPLIMIQSFQSLVMFLNY